MISQAVPGRRTDRDETGSASIWALLVTATAFTLLLGLVVDGGAVVDARIASTRAAAQAARTGADALSAASVRNGTDRVATSVATTRVQAYLRAAGVQGTARVEGHSVVVTVTGRSQTRVLGVIGIRSFPVRETRTADAITERGTP